MSSTKKLIISFAIALCVVLVTQFVWNRFLGDNEAVLYVLNKDIYIGEKITEEDIKFINVKHDSNMKHCYNVDIVDKVAKENLKEGQILQKNNMQDIKDFDENNEKYEYISIKIKDISDAVAYQLSEGENINVYFTSENILSNYNAQSIMQNKKTIKVLENKKIIGLYDASGNETEKGDVYNAIVLRVNEQEAMTFSNIKDEGSFNISLIK